MSDDLFLSATGKPIAEVRLPLAPLHEVPAALTREQIEAVDAAFQAEREPDLAAGLLTLWASTPFLVELAREHFPGREKAAEQAKDPPAE
jgi:hypothetical protein